MNTSTRSSGGPLAPLSANKISPIPPPQFHNGLLKTGPSQFSPGKENNVDEPVIKTTTAKANSSKKRKSDAVEEPQEVEEIDDDDPRLYPVDLTAQQVRRKVKDFIDGGNMKVGEFQEASAISRSSYQNFMKQSGRDKGEGCEAFIRAYKFFKKRELQGLKASGPSKAKKAKATKDGEKSDPYDTGGIKLDKEEIQEVPVFDTCDEVRKKIRAFLKKPGVTQAAFCRAICESFEEDRSIRPTQLKAFLGKKGPTAGNTSAVFYGSYVFFEKLRIKDGKPKSQMRQEMEEVYPRGMDVLEQMDGVYYFMHKDERLTQDKYGRKSFHRIR